MHIESQFDLGGPLLLFLVNHVLESLEGENVRLNFEEEPIKLLYLLIIHTDLSNLGSNHATQCLVSLVKIVIFGHLFDDKNWLDEYISKALGCILNIFELDFLLLRERKQIKHLGSNHEVQIDGTFEEVSDLRDDVLLAWRSVLDYLLQVRIFWPWVKVNVLKISKLVVWNDHVTTLFKHVLSLNY